MNEHSDDNSNTSIKPVKNDVKNRGIYVTPQPDFSLYLQQPKNNKRIQGVIKNGNICSQRKVNSVYTRFANTCPFDTVTEE